MAHLFSEFIDQLIASQRTVTIGTGEQALDGTIVAFDGEHEVVTFQSGRTRHFIPMASIRSFSEDDTGAGTRCYLELFKR